MPLAASMRSRLFAAPPLLRPQRPLRLLIGHREFSTSSSFRSNHHANSVDSSEVRHFDALASSWWDPHGPSRLLHLMNPLRHSFIAGCLSSQAEPFDALRKLHYLDVGCGGGIFAESAARLANTATVTGIDPSANVLAIAKAHARRDPWLTNEDKGNGTPRLRYLNMGIEQLPLPGGDGGKAAPDGQGYDILTLFEVLEHVSNPSAFLSTLLPHVRPGGWIVLSTIARTWTSWLTTKVVAEDLARIVPRGTHDWHKYINEQELCKWFEKQGWANPRAMGVVYMPGLGWRQVRGAEAWGNYFFGIRKTGAGQSTVK